jgi:hypothetical protein
VRPLGFFLRGRSRVPSLRGSFFGLRVSGIPSEAVRQQQCVREP